MAVLVSLIAACGTTRHTAPIIDRGAGKTSDAHRQPAYPVQVSKPIDANGYYAVKKGDTLIHIALEFGQNYRDLVVWNSLADANDIKVDQVLRVLPPNAGSASTQTQTGSVGIGSSVEVRPLSSSAPVQAASPQHNKTTPRGDKRPYSDTALAEMQKTESVTVAPLAVAPKEPSKITESKTVEKQSEVAAPSSSADDANIAWMWPAEGKVVATYEDGKKGIDIAGKIGQPIFAAGPGKVLYASSVRGYGNLVIVKHTNNLLSAYAHNKVILVKEGQSVAKGEKIAEMGNSDTDLAKLHFEIRRQGKPVDPSKYLPNR